MSKKDIKTTKKEDTKDNYKNQETIAVSLIIILSVICYILLSFTPYLYNKLPHSYTETYLIIIVIALTLLPYFQWLIFGRDEHVTPIVNINPPKDINSAEIEVYCYGYSTDKGVNSLLYYLSSKGYLEIKKSNNNYIVNKLKNYDGNNEIEKEYIDYFFHNNISTINLNIIKNKKSFYFFCINMQKKLNKLRKNLYQNDSAMFLRLIIILLCILGISICLLYTLFDFAWGLIFIMSLIVFLFSLLPIWFGVYFCCNYEQMKNSIKIETNSEKELESIKKHRKAYTIFAVIFMCLILSLFPIAYIALNKGISFNHPIEIIFEYVCIVICFICFNNMDRLNPKGRELKGKALGFKRFLEVTEKKKIDELIEKNPDYAKEIYPYAFALGISESYISYLDILTYSQNSKLYC